jgi:hypothetical protein
MFDAFNKLLRSNGTLILLTMIVLPYVVYAIWPPTNTPKHFVSFTKQPKSMEEIMTYSPAAISDSPWDNEFHSSITPIKEGE